MNTQTNGLLALIGVGRMGSAMAAGWLRRKRGGVPPAEIVFVSPELDPAAETLVKEFGVRHIKALDARTAAQATTVVLAVKPQILTGMLDDLGEMLREDALVISVAAGIGLRQLGDALPGRAIVRDMPNVAGAIGAGINVAICNEICDERKLRPLAEKLLKVTGPVEWLEEERLMGAATGVSGSGPAYVFLMCEALARAGEAEGLPADLAERLAVATVAGAGELLARGLKDGSADAAALRRSVTSPGGTTQAALDALTAGGGGLPALIRNAVSAAERRSRQLGAGGFDKK